MRSVNLNVLELCASDVTEMAKKLG
jgi:hypothetical protein